MAKNYVNFIILFKSRLIYSEIAKKNKTQKKPVSHFHSYFGSLIFLPTEFISYAVNVIICPTIKPLCDLRFIGFSIFETLFYCWVLKNVVHIPKV